MNKYILLYLVVCLMFSCSDSHEDKNSKSLSLHHRENFLLSDFVDEISYVRLEKSSDSKIGRINKMRYYNNNFFILDSDVSESLFIFDYNGKFLFKIGEKGNGPGEFTEVTAFCLDEFGNIYVYDGATFIMSVFDKSGQFIDSKRLGFYACDMEVQKDVIYFYTGYAESLFGKFNLFITSLDGKILSQQFPFEIPFYFKTNWNIRRFNNIISFVPGLDHSIYRFNDDQVIEEISFKFDDGASSTSESIDSSNPEDLLNMKSKIVDNFIENNELIYFNYFDDLSTFNFLLLKESNTIFNGKILNDLELLPFSPYCFGDDGNFIGVIMAEDVYSTKEYLSENPTYIKEGQQRFYREFESSNIDDNPIIAIYNLSH